VSSFTSVFLGQVTAVAYLGLVHNRTVSEISGPDLGMSYRVTINLTTILNNANLLLYES
jgi:hypothetical protein